MIRRMILALASAALTRLKERMPPRKTHTAKGRAAGALAKPVQPDEALAAVVGSQPLPRTELTKKVWEYIREHKLQDDQDRRRIRADDRLRAVLEGQDSVTMFELTKFVNRHLT
jgi:upstream activation factor subunit UAF30